jgi:hypothetical protein
VFVGGLSLFIWVFGAFLCLLAFLCFCGLATLFLCILHVYLGLFNIFFNKILLLIKKKLFFFLFLYILLSFFFLKEKKSNISCCVSLFCAGHLMMERVGYGMLGIPS